MKRKAKLILCMFLPVIFLMSQLNVNAAQDDFIEVPVEDIMIQSSSKGGINTYSDDEASLDACELGIGINKNGIGIMYTTRSIEIATEIGVKDMVLQEKTLLGWKDITIKDHYDYDTDIYMGSLVYLKAEVGKTYRVYCTHYAIIDGKEYTLYNITDSIVYN